MDCYIQSIIVELDSLHISHHNHQYYYLFIYMNISLDALCPSKMPPSRRWQRQVSPVFPALVLPLSTLNTSPTNSFSLQYLLTINLFHWWSLTDTLSLSHVPTNSSQLILSHSRYISWSISEHHTSSIQPFHNLHNLSLHPYQISHACFHCFFHSILTL